MIFKNIFWYVFLTRTPKVHFCSVLLCGVLEKIKYRKAQKVTLRIKFWVNFLDQTLFYQLRLYMRQRKIKINLTREHSISMLSLCRERDFLHWQKSTKKNSGINALLQLRHHKMSKYSKCWQNLTAVNPN